MKKGRDFRVKNMVSTPEDLLRKAAKLEPIKKSGKDRIRIDDEDEEELDYRVKRESILDYYDDGNSDEEDDEYDDEEESDDEEWEDEEEEA